MTYNILDGGIGREQRILDVLKTVGPDAVLLQEVTDPDIVQSFATTLNMHFFFAEGNSKRHLALLSRFPIMSCYSYHPFPLRHTLLEATIECASDRFIRLFGVHLQAHYAICNEWWRRWEIKTILQRVAKYHSNPSLIAGDFNAVAPEDRVNIQALPARFKIILFLQGGQIFRDTIAKIISAGFIDCYRVLHPCDDGFTLPTPVPHVRLDYIFANQSLARCIQSCDVVTKPPAVHKASDHYPIMAEFEL
ncbi:MAG: endonuclease/exonuclease/phosphatase family protein [Anaerolineae bacterium]|nr:endonuclease/exonuclease/phosphatase family protein [Anaerolineae bacterium]MDH7475711.1 endonuclease/exonuclease/phosphatase family protein [Anaerolineae bacterium]